MKKMSSLGGFCSNFPEHLNVVKFPPPKSMEISLEISQGNFPGKFPELSRTFTLEISINFSGWNILLAVLCGRDR